MTGMAPFESGPVEAMLEQWTRERPDLDPSSLGLVARVARLARTIEENAKTVLDRFGLSESDFQLLAALRRAGPDYQQSPRELLEPLMVSSGGLTTWIDRLEQAGLVQRQPNPEDRRGILVQLSDKGRALADEVLTAYLANQQAVLDTALSREEQTTLSNLLRRLLTAVSTAGQQGG